MSRSQLQLPPEGTAPSTNPLQQPPCSPVTTTTTDGTSSTISKPNDGGSSSSSSADQIRYRQQRILLLYHASKCRRSDGDNCGGCSVPHCATMKRLWEHFAVCQDQVKCQYRHCVCSRHALTHFQRCKDASCLVCGPVRKYIRSRRTGGSTDDDHGGNGPSQQGGPSQGGDGGPSQGGNGGPSQGGNGGPSQGGNGGPSQGGNGGPSQGGNGGPSQGGSGVPSGRRQQQQSQPQSQSQPSQQMKQQQQPPPLQQMHLAKQLKHQPSQQLQHQPSQQLHQHQQPPPQLQQQQTPPQLDRQQPQKILQQQLLQQQQQPQLQQQPMQPPPRQLQLPPHQQQLHLPHQASQQQLQLHLQRQAQVQLQQQPHLQLHQSLQLQSQRQVLPLQQQQSQFQQPPVQTSLTQQQKQQQRLSIPNAMLQTTQVSMQLPSAGIPQSNAGCAQSQNNTFSLEATMSTGLATTSSQQPIMEPPAKRLKTTTASTSATTPSLDGSFCLEPRPIAVGPAPVAPPGPAAPVAKDAGCDRQSENVFQKQKRILLLHHAAKCRHGGDDSGDGENDTSPCPSTPHCRQMKRLWKHFALCKNHRCTVPHCVSSRYILTHYRQCRDDACAVCGPVRKVIGKSACTSVSGDDREGETAVLQTTTGSVSASRDAPSVASSDVDDNAVIHNDAISVSSSSAAASVALTAFGGLSSLPSPAGVDNSIRQTQPSAALTSSVMSSSLPPSFGTTTNASSSNSSGLEISAAASVVSLPTSLSTVGTRTVTVGSVPKVGSQQHLQQPSVPSFSSAILSANAVAEAVVKGPLTTHAASSAVGGSLGHDTIAPLIHPGVPPVQEQTAAAGTHAIAEAVAPPFPDGTDALWHPQLLVAAAAAGGATDNTPNFGKAFWLDKDTNAKKRQEKMDTSQQTTMQTQPTKPQHQQDDQPAVVSPNEQQSLQKRRQEEETKKKPSRDMEQTTALRRLAADVIPMTTSRLRSKCLRMLQNLRDQLCSGAVQPFLNEFDDFRWQRRKEPLELVEDRLVHGTYTTLEEFEDEVRQAFCCYLLVPPRMISHNITNSDDGITYGFAEDSMDLFELVQASFVTDLEAADILGDHC